MCHARQTAASAPGVCRVPNSVCRGKKLRMKSLLRCDDVFRLRAGLHSREAGGVPTSAQSLDKQHTGNQPLALDHRELLLVGKQIALCCHYVQIANKSPAIAAGGNVQSATRGIDGLLLRMLGLDQHAQSRDFVLPLLERAQDRLTVAGYIRVVACARKLHLRAARSTSET